ncbi:putative leucine-rich repeat domain superfamily, F-box-like domain superfamily [Helianthus anomalus]
MLLVTPNVNLIFVLLIFWVVSEIGEMDRISQLPDFIVHHIISFLKTPKDLVRMSVLSKTWLHLTSSFPILDFNIGDFRSRESFFNYVEYTTSRFCHQNLPAHSLRLVKFLRDPADLDIVDRCLERVLRNGIKELVIYLHNSGYLGF